VDADSTTSNCDSLALYLQYPPPAGGQAIAVLLIAAMALLKAIPGILALPFLGESEATNWFYMAQNMLGSILEKMGASGPSAMIIEGFLNQNKVITNPLDLLKAGESAASVLQPALTNIENQNTLSSLKALYAQNKCIPANCFQSYASIMAKDGTPFQICSDATGGTDTGDRQGDLSGGGSGGGVGQAGSTALIPMSSLAIPNLMPFGNSSSFSLNPFPNPSLTTTSSLPSRKS
jgi:hypothetical protein